MTPWFVLLVAATSTIDVEITLDHVARIEVSGCRDSDREVDELRVGAAGVTACAKRRCKTKQRVELSCTDGVAKTAGGDKRLPERVAIHVDTGRLVVVAPVELERYVAGVVRAELGEAPDAARGAQAIVSRTYAMNALVAPRHEHTHVCDLTHCQVFRPTARVAAEPGRILLDDRGRVAEVYFHGACGGRTIAPREAWPRSSSTAPGVDDRREDGEPWCRDGRASWSYTIDVEALATLLSKSLGRTLDPKTLAVEVRGAEAMVGDERAQRRVPARDLARTIAKARGWNTVESPRFTVTRRGRQVRFEGTGRGHGVGLCQSGAIARAQAGWTTERILDAYFPTYAVQEVAGPPLRVATTGDYPPFSESKPTGDEGVDIDLARRIGARLKRPVVFVRTTWPTLMADLAAGRYDLALSGITVTDARRRVASFSRPYYRGAKRAVVRCADEERLASLAAIDRPKHRVVVNPGGTNEKFVRRHVKKAKIRVTKTNLEIYDVLEAGGADALFTDAIEADYQTKRREALCIGAGGERFEPFDIAAMAPKGSSLIEAVDATLAALASSGELAQIFARHQ